ncbi:MAG TPA: DUF1992 domain-containing protein [Peptococcaceae bacterium]|nr:DUF1992 domain-containing protein [Peptococcaceae bacterium]
MYDIFAKIALSKIEEAIKNGEFENLPGQGQPINLEYLAAIPPEKRAAYTVLKNSGVLPQEAQLLKEIAGLKEKLSTCPEGVTRETLQKKLRETELKYKLLLETSRKRKR